MQGPTTIGVLDIFGFECFAVNSFEQLCINYTNEKLQFHFNAHIFLLEMEIYKRERLDVKAITFRDNQGCLDLIEQKRTGLMAMIEEEIYVPKGSDFTLLEKLHTQNHGYNDFYAKPVSRSGRGNKDSLSPQEAFIVKHYAGPVPYKVADFLEKCKDRLPPDSEELLKSSKNQLVAGFFASAGGMDAPKGGRPATLGSKFKDSMQGLYDMLSATSPHFVRPHCFVVVTPALRLSLISGKLSTDQVCEAQLSQEKCIRLEIHLVSVDIPCGTCYADCICIVNQSDCTLFYNQCSRCLTMPQL